MACLCLWPASVYVIEAVLGQRFPEDATHVEYFSTPEKPEYENHAFKLKLEKSGKEIAVPPDRDAATVLVEHGYALDLKCSDGICGVCQCGLLDGVVEHLDFVLSENQRQSTIVFCQSRAVFCTLICDMTPKSSSYH